MTSCSGKTSTRSRSRGTTAASIVDRGMRLTWIRVTAVSVTAALAVFATGCATEGPLSASGKPISKAALDTAHQRVQQEQIPPDLQPYYVSMYAEGRENIALYAMEGGVEALRTGQLDQAERLLNLAPQDTDGL